MLWANRYFSAWENDGTINRPEEAEYKPGQFFTGGCEGHFIVLDANPAPCCARPA